MTQSFALTDCNSFEFVGQANASSPTAFNIAGKTQSNATSADSELRFTEASTDQYTVEWCENNAGTLECSSVHNDELNLAGSWKIVVTFHNSGASLRFLITANAMTTTIDVDRKADERFFSCDWPSSTATSLADSELCYHYNNGDCGATDAVATADKIFWKFKAKFDDVFSEQTIAQSPESKLLLNQGKLEFSKSNTPTFDVKFEMYFVADTEYDLMLMYDSGANLMALMLDSEIVETKSIPNAVEFAMSAGEIGCAGGVANLNGIIERFEVGAADISHQSWQDYQAQRSLTESYDDNFVGTNTETDTACDDHLDCVTAEMDILTNSMCHNINFESDVTIVTDDNGVTHGPWDMLKQFSCDDVLGPDCWEAYGTWVNNMEDMLKEVKQDFGHCEHIHTDYGNKHNECRLIGDLCYSKRCKLGQELITMLLDMKYDGALDEVMTYINAKGDIESIDGSNVVFKTKQQNVPTFNTSSEIPTVSEYTETKVTSKVVVKMATTNAFVDLTCSR